jgi:hypothetical protein
LILLVFEPLFLPLLIIPVEFPLSDVLNIFLHLWNNNIIEKVEDIENHAEDINQVKGYSHRIILDEALLEK